MFLYSWNKHKLSHLASVFWKFAHLLVALNRVQQHWLSKNYIICVRRWTKYHFALPSCLPASGLDGVCAAGGSSFIHSTWKKQSTNPLMMSMPQEKHLILSSHLQTWFETISVVYMTHACFHANGPKKIECFSDRWFKKEILVSMLQVERQGFPFLLSNPNPETHITGQSRGSSQADFIFFQDKNGSIWV